MLRLSLNPCILPCQVGAVRTNEEAGTTMRERRVGAILIGFVFVGVAFAGCGTSSATKIIVVTATPSRSVQAPASAPTAAPVRPASGGPASSSSGAEHFDRSNWALLQTDPNAHKGASVDIVGKVFTSPQRDARGTYWQMWSDPKNNEWNTVVGVADPNFQIAQDQYVHVTGTVKGQYQGKNLLGGDVNAVEVLASRADIASPLAAAPPALRTVQANLSQTQNGVTISLSKIEFAAIETRVFVSVSNASSSTAHFYDFNAKVVQGTTQYSSNSAGDYPQVQSDILPGVTSSGVVVFPSMGPGRATRLVFGAGSNNYNVNFQPYQFDLTRTGSPPVPPSQASAMGAIGQTDAALIRAALRKSNDAWAASMECACDHGLDSIKTGSDLQSNLQAVQSLQKSGQHWAITLHSYSIASVSLLSAASARALVSKNETSLIYQGTKLLQTCDGPYQVRYQLVKVGELWKVDATRVVGGGQSCR